mmetsp:Transcript_43528/g.71779  ORF Transcript_43528/g.71779 Transcript_43528/m.71779 type:complete len:204 (+) Transcript_43528:42-653(+)
MAVGTCSGASARPTTTAAIGSPLLELNLLIDALQVIAFFVEFFLSWICQHFVGFTNHLEHLFSIFSLILVQVRFLVRVPLGCALSVSLFDLQLGCHGWHSKNFIVVLPLVLPQQKLCIFKLVIHTFVWMPRKEGLKLFDCILMTFKGLKSLSTIEVRLHKRVVSVGSLTDVFQNAAPVFQSHARFGTFRIEGCHHGRIVWAEL